MASNPDGTEWALAFRFIPQALEQADPQTNDVVWVAEGIYRPDESPTYPNGITPVTAAARAMSFKLKNGVALYGGFVGTETSLDQSDPENNETILSGDLAGDDADTNFNGIPDGFEADPPDYSDMAENSIHIVVALSTEEDEIGPSTILDGFMIRGGNANTIDPDEEVSGENVRGAALFCGGAGTGGDPDRSIDIKSSPTIAQSRFDFNHAGYGEAGYAAAIYTSYGDPVLRDMCTFADNHAKTCGGATVIESEGVFTALACVYQNNFAERSGGAHQSRGVDAHTIIHSCQFFDNKTTHVGIGNGGAITLIHGTGELVNCELLGNSTTKQGGGARLENTNVLNCTVSGNKTTVGTLLRPGGGGIWVESGSTVTIKNTIVYGNTSLDGDPEDPQPIGSTLQQQIDGPGSWENYTTYSDIQTDGSPVSGTGNINEDPEFKDTDNLRLTSCSPCIDVGDYDDPEENPVPDFPFPDDDFDINNDGDYDEATPDVETKKRILNGNDTTGAVIDMGAHEYDPNCPEDLSDSGEVNGTDLAQLLAAWGQHDPPTCHDADLNGDCRVDGRDLAILLNAWGDCEGVCNQDFGGGGGGDEEGDEGTIDQLVAWFLAGDMVAIIQWLIEQGY